MKNGRDILFSAFWSPKGWKSDRERGVSDEDFAIAKEQGYMFDYPEVISHGEYMERLDDVLKRITPEDVANAFLYSLSTRRLEYRSALGSYWYAAAIPPHEKDSSSGKSYMNTFSGLAEVVRPEENIPCCICGWYSWKSSPDEDELNMGLNVFNFERYKWGGVRHDKGDYALFDLEQFLRLKKYPHTQEDEEILHRILDCVYTLEPRDKAANLQKAITSARIFKSNSNEVGELLDILGICGVLSSREYPCYAEKFCGIIGDRDAPEHKNDRAYPINRWRAADGVNLQRYKAVFGREYKR